MIGSRAIIFNNYIFIYSLQRSETLIIVYGFCLISFLYRFVCFASAVYVPELWPIETHLRGSGFFNAIGIAVTIFTPYGVVFLLTHVGSVSVFIAVGIVLINYCLFLEETYENNNRTRFL